MIDKTAKTISAIMSPFWVPTIAMAVVLFTSYLVLAPLAQRLMSLGVILLITGIIPFTSLVVMKRMGVIGNLDVTNRAQRWAPYTVILVCYLCCSFAMWRIGFPGVVVRMMLGGSAAVLIQLLVNFRWKISGHGAATGALVAMIMRESISMITAVPTLVPYIVAALLLSGLTGTSRLILDRHTPGQVLAGWLNGFLCVWFFTL